MIIDLTEVRDEIYEFTRTYEFSKEELSESQIIDIKDLVVTGTIDDIGSDYGINLNIKATLILPSSLTLKEVPYEINIDVSGYLNEILAEIDENFEIKGNKLDILPIIWENILAEIPMKVVGENESVDSLEGEGWEVLTEEKEDVNNPFQGLSELMKSEVE